MSQIIGLYGESESGKTSLCKQTAQKLMTQGITVNGFLSEAVFDGSRKVGIDTVLIPGRETKPLARLAARNSEFILGKWEINLETCAWAEAAIQELPEKNVLMIDELGPLEVREHKGWSRALEILDGGAFRLAIITFRPELLCYFDRRYPGMIQILVEPGRQSILENCLLDMIYSLP